MFDELHSIKLSGKEYPIKCDMLVLEKIQEAYGTIGEFEKAIMTWEPELDENGDEMVDGEGRTRYHGKFPEARAVNDALVWMVNEGEAIMAEAEGRAAVKYSKEEIVRKVDITLTELANKLHDEFYRCFRIKNAETTQGTKKMEEADR